MESTRGETVQKLERSSTRDIKVPVATPIRLEAMN